MHELIGSVVVDTDGAHLGHGHRRWWPIRPATSSSSTAVRSCPCASSSTRSAGRVVVDGARRAPRPARHVGRAPVRDRRLHHLPRARRALLRRARCWAGPGTDGAPRPARARPARRRRRRPTLGRRRPLRRRGRHGARPRPVFAAVEAADPPRPLYLLGPGGRRLDQRVVEELASSGASASGGFSLLCGRYEGVDQRVADHLVDGELSIGDYVLGGGEVAALVVIEAVARLVPGRHGQRGLGRRRELHARGCSSTPSTPGRPCSGAGRCPRSC